MNILGELVQRPFDMGRHIGLPILEDVQHRDQDTLVSTLVSDCEPKLTLRTITMGRKSR